MYGYIYRITDLTNGKCYIGQHKYDKPELDPKYHGSSYILRNQIKAHPERFLEELLMICATLEELNYFENYFIEHMNTLAPNGYNLNTGGDHYEVSEEVRRRLSESLKGKLTWNKGKKNVYSEETLRKMSEAHKSEKNGMYGKTHSKEARRKIGEAEKGNIYFKGKTHSAETRQKLSEANKGKHHSEETLRKISKATSGENNPMYSKTHSEETRRKISETHKGKKHSEETRRKMSETHKGLHKGRHWYNNGYQNKFCKECPSGFKPGRLKKH